MKYELVGCCVHMLIDNIFSKLILYYILGVESQFFQSTKTPYVNSSGYRGSCGVLDIFLDLFLQVHILRSKGLFVVCSMPHCKELHCTPS